MKGFCRFVALFACVVLGLSSGLQAQSSGVAPGFKAAYPGKGTVTVEGNWRFHTSDDLSWADPKLDDSQWETITADGTWGSQTHPGHTGFAWYRRAVEIDGVHGQLSLLVPAVADAYEVYWNGEKLGGDGRLPPHVDWKAFPRTNLFQLPKADATGTLKGELTLRVWKAALSTLEENDGGGLSGPPKIGDSKVLADGYRLAGALYQQRRLLGLLECALMLVIGLFALGTWARDRRNALFLWLGLFLCASSGYGPLGITAFRDSATLGWFQAYIGVVVVVASLSIWAMVMTLFGLVQEQLWRVLTGVIAGSLVVAQSVDVWTQFVWGNAGPSIQMADWLATVVFSVLPLYGLVLLVAGLTRRRDLDLIPAVVACSLLDLYTIAKGTLHLGQDYTLNVRDQITALMLVVLVWTVLRQQGKTRRQQLVLEAEVKSAKEVQQVLVPEAMEPVAGFAISTLYWPAEEVGGDLFQVLPGNDGDVLIVLADVSGKGLKAAMTVSVLVGAVRTLAEYTTSPVEVLQGLTDGGFATCVVMHVSAGGEVAMANAGHLAPFVNGEEMAVTGSLPLGLAYEAQFEESRFSLNEGDDVTVYTDGVLEAQSKSGELYGFERAADIMRPRPTVRAIAEAAKAFGQMDDITVVKIVRVHAEDARERMSVDLQTVAVA
jgi:hypothetical protein